MYSNKKNGAFLSVTWEIWEVRRVQLTCPLYHDPSARGYVTRVTETGHLSTARTMEPFSLRVGNDISRSWQVCKRCGVSSHVWVHCRAGGSGTRSTFFRQSGLDFTISTWSMFIHFVRQRQLQILKWNNICKELSIHDDYYLLRCEAV
jgi:hypothetical protein